MNINECKIGMKVKDNLITSWLNKGNGEIVGFCMNVQDRKTLIVKWEKNLWGDEGKKTMISAQNVDFVD